MTSQRIGLALSGGGIRAAVFHLGVLKWLAENDLMEQIARVSSVSGGSLCIGLVYSHNHLRWPTSAEYLERVLPEITEVIQRADIENAALARLLTAPWWWNRKVNLLANVLRRYWGITGVMADLDQKPQWYINCTTFETGKRFRFTQENMGDYRIGYAKRPKIPLADAIAASAGFPILVGPYKMKMDGHSWETSSWGDAPALDGEKYIHLWDGGVYDNLGLESVYKMDQGGGLTEGIDYLLVSNASGAIGYKKRKMGFSAGNLKRLLDISMDQVCALRNRSVMDYIKRTGNGMYLNIGNSARKIAEAGGVPQELRDGLIHQCMDAASVLKVRNYPTTLNRPSKEDYAFILRHGYEVAKCTGLCYQARVSRAGAKN